MDLLQPEAACHVPMRDTESCLPGGSLGITTCYLKTNGRPGLLGSLSHVSLANALVQAIGASSFVFTGLRHADGLFPFTLVFAALMSGLLEQAPTWRNPLSRR
jgi:hypothetical protein